MTQLLSKKFAYLLFVGFALFMVFCNAKAGTKQVTVIFENTSVSPINLSYEIFWKDSKGARHHFIKDNINQLTPHGKYYTTLPRVDTSRTPIAEVTSVFMNNRRLFIQNCAKTISYSNQLQIQITFIDDSVPQVNCNYIDV
jgi:hypothetical protein